MISLSQVKRRERNVWTWNDARPWLCMMAKTSELLVIGYEQGEELSVRWEIEPVRVWL